MAIFRTIPKNIRIMDNEIWFTYKQNKGISVNKALALSMELKVVLRICRFMPKYLKRSNEAIRNQNISFYGEYIRLRNFTRIINKRRAK